jgi:hypothetical protein
MIRLQVEGGQYELLKAFRQFKGLAGGHSLLLSEPEFAGSIKKVLQLLSKHCTNTTIHC